MIQPETLAFFDRNRRRPAHVYRHAAKIDHETPTVKSFWILLDSSCAWFSSYTKTRVKNYMNYGALSQQTLLLSQEQGQQRLTCSSCGYTVATAF